MNSKYLKKVPMVGLAVISGVCTYKYFVQFGDKFRTTTQVHELDRGPQKQDKPTGENKDSSRKNQILKKVNRKLNIFPELRSNLSNNPWTLLGIAESQDRHSRMSGVQSLARHHCWNAEDYELIAQECDIRTLVGLARTQHADKRFFFKPPHPPSTHEPTEDMLRKLLASLPTDGLDKCTKFFTTSALQDQTEKTKSKGGLWCFGGTGLNFTESVAAVSEEQVVLFCLQALVRHSNVPDHCPVMVDNGCFDLFKIIYRSRRHNIKILRALCRILSNLATDNSLHGKIIDSGWLTILRHWMSAPDIQLSLTATKALANMDTDVEDRKYSDGVYLIHPKYRFNEPIYADVIFVHGLQGGPFVSWKQRDPGPGEKDTQTAYSLCWPKDWLAKDCPHVRILSVEYDSSLSEWADICPFESEKRLLSERSKTMLNKLKDAGVGRRPVIWVAHSMGGLLVKQMLADASQDQEMKHIIQNNAGMVFYGVPHKGSRLAAYVKQTKSLLYPSVEVQELEYGSENLQKLHDNFKSLLFKRGTPLLSFCEGLQTELPLNLKVHIVPEASADPGFGEVYVLDDVDHTAVCKPRSKTSQLYQHTLHFILDCIPEYIVDHILQATAVPQEDGLPDVV